MTVWIAINCPGCHSTDVIRNGKTPHRKQRYLCRNKECPRCTFIVDYTNKGYQPEVKQKIVDMSVNGSGVREQLLKEASDASRVLGANALRQSTFY